MMTTFTSPCRTADMPTMRKTRNMSLTPLIKSSNDYKWSRNTPAGSTVGGQIDLPTIVVGQDQSWRDKAACKNYPELDFTPYALNLTIIKACKKVCATCPVQEECLQWALEADDRFSVCGGFTYKERKKLKR